MCLTKTSSDFHYELFQKDKMDKILKRFTDILCGTLDNMAQVARERVAGRQVHPYAKHVTAICDHKIINRPSNHEGLYILEESYYIPPGKTEAEMELKPLLFYMRSDGKNKALLQSVKIPEKYTKAEVTNDNEDLVFDWHDLTFSPFGVAEYTLQVTDQFTVNHIANMGNGITFQLIETLSDEGLEVMELVRKDGVKITPYDTPIEYRNV